MISAVTASNTLAVAEAAAQHLQPGSVFLDLNSASPGTKQRCAVLIEACGAHYVEAGVMTSVPPYGIKTPMLLGGPLAAGLAVLCSNWGMDVKAVSEKIGVASAVKMCCSVMIKGLEELVIESYTTARAYGVKRMFYRSLPRPFPASTGHQPEATFSQEWFSMVSAAPKKCVNLPTWSGRQVLSRSSQSRRV